LLRYKETAVTKKPYSVQLIELRYRRDFSELCAELRTKGMSWRDIGQKFGLHWTLVWRHAKRSDEQEEQLTAAR
jgi:predicted patatin/cPLA2 family phospholipase